MTPIIVTGVALLGLAVGSFLNVVIHRVPNNLSLLRPASRCPSCLTPIKNRHNVPVLGWVMLRGRCATCRTRISVRYPLVELATSVLFVAITVRLMKIERSSAIPLYLYVGAIGIALTLIDVDVRRLPDSIVLPSYAVVAVLIGFSGLIEGSLGAIVRAVLGGLILFSFYYLIAFIYPAGMGFGDVKLSGLLGSTLAFLSWPALFIGGMGAFVLGGVAGIWVIVRGGSRKSALPFGPFMIAAALIALFWANSLWSSYVGITVGT